MLESLVEVAPSGGTRPSQLHEIPHLHCLFSFGVVALEVQHGRLVHVSPPQWPVRAFLQTHLHHPLRSPPDHHVLLRSHLAAVDQRPPSLC